jgi:hypothetical protein
VPLNAQGIWIYEESEDAAPFSTLLNKLGLSVSDVIAELLGDSGNLGIVLTSGVTNVSGYALEVRQVGPHVYISGRAEKATATATQVWGTLPAGISPPARITDGDVDASTFSNNVTRVYLTTAGLLTTTGTPTTNAKLGFTLYYMAAS